MNPKNARRPARRTPTRPVALILATLLLAAVPALRAQGVQHLVPSPATPTIQSAINVAVDGDQVVVAAGTYLENIDFLGKAITVTGAGPYATIIDGSANPTTTIAMINGEGAGTVLEKVGVTGGSGWITPNPPPGVNVGSGGGGLYLATFGGTAVPTNPVSSVLIQNCRFFGCTAAVGGGVYVGGGEADATMVDCIIESNTAIFSLNLSPGLGGGVAFAGRILLMDRCTIQNNSSGDGGGVHVTGNTLHMTDCDVRSNAAIDPAGVVAQGGAMAGSTLNGVFEGCIFADNLTQGGRTINLSGNGNQGNSGIVFRSCLVADNVANHQSVGFLAGRFTLQSCTLTNNLDTAPLGASLLLVESQWPINVTNTIVQGNTAGLAQGAFSGTATGVITYSNIQGGAPGVGNLDVSPGFVDPAGGDYRLAHGSPMVNVGDPAGVAQIAFDFEGEPRVMYGLPDIGADECDDIAYHASSGGTLFDPAMPLAVASTLTVAGDDGGLDHRVQVPLHAPWTLDYDSPDWMAAPPPFAIFGVLGEPSLLSVATLPFGFGEMAFAPCPIAPGFEGPLFTLATSVAGMPCATLLPAAPGDLAIGPISGCPIPLDVGFQALLIDDQGQPQISNLLIVQIR